MCGICGISLAPGSTLNATKTTRTLLTAIEERGRHATGIATAGCTRPLHVTKAAMPARQFVHKVHVPDGATAILGHTRWASHGSPADNDNNHPIVVEAAHGGTVAGVHNGVLMNDDDLFDELGPESRIAEVDSEAAFAWIARSGLDIPDALADVRGSAALAWIDSTEPDTVHLARAESSPVHLGHLIDGSMLFASTASAVRAGAKAAGIDIKALVPVDEGTHLVIRGGRIQLRERFDVDTRILTATERQALNL